MSRGIIVLDPGHGQFGNQYPVLPGTYEGTQNFHLALHLKEELEKKDFTVLLTRNAVEEDPSLEQRGRMAGENNALIFISLHSNAPGSATPPERYNKCRGSVVYYSMTDEEKNAKIAKALNDCVVKAMNTEDRGIKTRSYPDQPTMDYYGVIRHSAASGCKQAFIIEHGFHTNPEDAAFLSNEDCLAALAAAEAETLDKLF